jgi:hypothetical protein
MSHIDILIFKLITEAQEHVLLTTLESQRLNATPVLCVQRIELSVFYISVD